MAWATILEDGFFADATEMLALGDIVLVSAADGARIACVARSPSNSPRLASIS